MVCVAFNSNFHGVVYGKDFSLGIEGDADGKDFHSVSFHQKKKKRKAMAERSLKLEYLNLSQAKWEETL